MLKRKINPDNLIWKREYNIGDYKTDLEHQSLFKLAKKALMVRTIENDEKEIQELKNIIHSLYNYVATHFKNEEKYMKSINFPEFNRHRQIHKDMLKTLHEFILTLNNLTIDEIEQNLYKFIEDYFITHIVDEDMLIGTWKKSLRELRNNGKWQNEYITGIDSIDNEHKIIFKILDEAFEEVDEEDRETKIKKVLTHLYDFMKEHFKSEEKYMEEINYPGIDEHKKIHHEIVQSCNKLLIQINDTDDILFEKKLAQLIDEHIIAHMLNEDKKITDYIDRQ